MIRRILQFCDRWTEAFVRDRYFLLKLFLLALGLRIGLILLHPQVNLISDMLGYHESGMSLLQNGDLRVKGRLSASRPPLYPIFIYIIYYLFGAGNIIAVRISQAILGAITCLLTYRLGEKVFNRRAAVWAGLLMAIYPAAWNFSDLILSETLFIFLFVAGVLFLVDLPGGRFSDAIFAGLFLGLATLTRTALYLFPVFFSIVAVMIFRERWKMLPRLVVFVVMFWLILIPWQARNARVFGKPLLSTKSGVDLFFYNHNSFSLILYNYCNMDPKELQGVIAWQLSETQKDELCKKAALDWIREHPLLFLFKGVRMQWNYFGVEREFGWSLLAGYWGKVPRWQLALILLVTAPGIYLLMPLFIWGVIYAWDRSPARITLLLIIAYFLALTFVYYGFARHRAPLNPIMMVYAGYLLANWRPAVDDLRIHSITRRLRAVLAISIFGFFIIGWLLELYVDLGSALHLGFTHELWKNMVPGQ
jgi:4-amino-4-deoxy-L-arabinose transferase-like glycosyltransferase